MTEEEIHVGKFDLLRVDCCVDYRWKMKWQATKDWFTIIYFVYTRNYNCEVEIDPSDVLRLYSMNSIELLYRYNDLGITTIE